VTKLLAVRAIGVPRDLFADVVPKVVAGWRGRAAVESPTEARLKIATWITRFYNTRRLHRVCGYRSPIDHEHDHHANSAPEPAA
jgi:transposase InsO family protein